MISTGQKMSVEEFRKLRGEPPRPRADFPSTPLRDMPMLGVRPMRARHERGKMNKRERAYADKLECLRLAGEIVRWRFEAIKLRLADNTTYTPDFMVTLLDRIELHEVKGHWEDDARAKWKITAELYPEFVFVAVSKKGEEVYRGKD